MNDYPIFISSADIYADMWPIFFELFKKYWPEFDGLIYLNTETKEFQFEGLNIRCTRVGNLGSFGKVFRAGLDKTESPYILLIMIDYFFMGKVDNLLVKEYFEYFKNNNLDSLCMVNQNYSKSEKLDKNGLYRVIPPSKDLFSFQIAFWQVGKLRSMVLPHENPWMSEWFGTKRANSVKLNLVFPEKGYEPISYLLEGALHKGKWVAPIISFLNSEGYNIDYNIRGYFFDKEQTLVNRIKIKKMIYYNGLLAFIYRIKIWILKLN